MFMNLSRSALPKFHVILLIHVVQAELLLLRIPLCYSRKCCEILPSRFAVELHALVLLSKILRDSDLGEPLKMSSSVLLRHSEKCCKIPTQMNFRKYFWECLHYGGWLEIQCNCLVALKMSTLHNFQTYIKCWTLLAIQCNSLMTWK